MLRNIDKKLLKENIEYRPDFGTVEIIMVIGGGSKDKAGYSQYHICAELLHGHEN